MAAGAAPAPALADGHGVVTRNGRVGPLTIGRSGEAAVRRFAGRPTRVQDGVGEGGVALTSYRYRCGAACNTYFFFDARGRLQNFYTRSKHYFTSGGTRVGHTLEDAERQEHKAAERQGCGGFFGIVRKGKGFLSISIDPDTERVDIIAAWGQNSVLGC